MFQLKSLLTKVQLFILLSFGICVAALALTPPGTIIFNRASIFYELRSDDSGNGVGNDSGDESGSENLQQSVSNAARVAVGKSYAFAVENAHNLSVTAGVVVQFPHRISNQGNTEDSYEFIFNEDEPLFADDAFDSPTVFLDANSNGRIEADEPVLVQTGQLVPGGELDVVVTARLSAAIQNGEQREFPFMVASVLSDKTQTVTNVVTVGSSGEFEISLTTAQSCEVPLFEGDSLVHRTEITNSGFGVLEGSSYLIDASAKQGIVVEIPVTDNTVFNGFDTATNNAINGLNLVQLESFASNEWISVAALDPGDANQVKAVGYFITPELLVNDEVAVFITRFSVSENPESQGTALTTAVYGVDSDLLPDTISNSTCNTFASIAAFDQNELQFLESAPDLLLTGASPDFNSDTDFVSAERYLLKRNDGDPYSTPRDGIYLQLKVSETNHPDILTDREGNRYVIVGIESGLTGDEVDVVLLQTADPQTFRSVAAIQLSADIRSNGGTCPLFENSAEVTQRIDQENPTCVLQSTDGDQLQAVFGSSGRGTAVASAVSVSRQSVVFDAQTLAPVSGVALQLRRSDTNEVATDDITGVSYNFITDAQGRFSIPRLQDDIGYYISVTAPDGFQFPSVVPPVQLPDFLVHGLSYGVDGLDGVEQSGVFFGASINAQDSIDIPLDRQTVAQVLTTDKVALQTTVDIGQSVSYTITLLSAVDDLLNVIVTDTLPFGFRFIPGSAVLDGEQASEPVQTENGLEFTIGELTAQQPVQLTYAARPSAAAVDGNGVNTAIAAGLTVGGADVESAPATAKVTLQRAGLFSDRAALFGKIYVDQNCDGIQNNKEWPIGGVRLYLQDGTYVITDADGLYSVYGLDPGRYVVQVDTHTLPDGLDLKPLSVEHLADADSRLIDLSNGDFHRADFAAGCPAANAEAIFAELKRRNSSIDGSWYLQHAENLNNRQARGSTVLNDLHRNPSTIDGDLSSGVLDAPEGFDFGSISGRADLTEAEIGSVAESLAANNAHEKQRMVDVKQIVPTITQEQASEGTWLWPKNSMSINGRFVAVVKAGIDPTLYVNGKAVPDSQIGERMLNRREKAQVVAWYGVELKSGENSLEVKGTGPFGNERVLATGVFKRPSAGTQIVLDAQSTDIPADAGRSTLPITINILDDNGYPALGVYYVTLESSDGYWLEPDIQDKEPGRQIRIENGKRTVYYRSSGTAGEVQVRVSTASFADELVINQLSQKRPLVVSGFIEAGGYFATEQLGEFNASTDLGQLDERGRFESRAALFIKGTVKDKYNLTLSYDSDSDNDTELLRDIDPTLYYPVHGDASVRGFEAQSRSKLYVRVERDKHSLMWGDYVTDTGADRRDLARINRTLTGVNGVYNDGKNRLHVFAARENNQNIIEELPGNGSALLYRLQQVPIVPNSETVELITRSLDNPDLIVEKVRLSDTGDYFVDDETGFLSFASSIPTLDTDQNPVFIRITYDVEQGGDKYLVSGARFDRVVSENLALGASVTHDGHATESRDLIGVYGDYKIGTKTRLSVSLARSDSAQAGVGHAHSVSLDHNWSQGNAASTSITHQRADQDFTNAGSSVSSGRTETRISHTQKTGSQSRLLLEANDSRVTANDEERLAVGASVETTLKNWKAKAGLRHIKQKSGGDEDSFVTSVLGAGRKFSALGRDGELNIEYEQDLAQARRRRIAAGAKLALHNEVNGYTRYELSNSLLGIAGITGGLESESFTLGVESRALRSTRLYSEYRMRGEFESADYESASGVRGDYEIQDGLRISPHFEYIERLGGVIGDSVAASVGVTDTRNQNSRRLIRLETRRSSNSDYYGLRASVTARVNRDWTGILADNYSHQNNDGGESVRRHLLVAALARRPKYDNRHHMLFLYKLNQERGVVSGVDRTLHILSTHQNLQIDDETVLSGRIGVKQDNSRFAFSRVSDFALLADARLSFDIGRRFNFDTGIGALSTNGSSEIRYSMGLGVNYILNKNLRLSVAYNLVGFKDNDLDAQQYNARGAHVGVQYKLDEELFKWLE